MARDGFYFLIPLVAGSAAALWVGWTSAGVVMAAAAAFVGFFFRDPFRAVPAGAGVIVSPADGRVVRIEIGPEGVEISIFLSLFNVHINRSPIEGLIRDVAYRPGAFHAAFTNIASIENEQNTLMIANSDFAVTCSQIAGLLARRIVCWKRPGDEVARGERIGLIKFGSRVDLVIPQEANLKVRVGDKVRGGSSTIAIMEIS